MSPTEIETTTMSKSNPRIDRHALLASDARGGVFGEGVTSEPELDVKRTSENTESSMLVGCHPTLDQHC